jgi:RimJ/RimL family protein N-acetyltransferase
LDQLLRIAGLKRSHSEELASNQRFAINLNKLNNTAVSSANVSVVDSRDSLVNLLKMALKTAPESRAYGSLTTRSTALDFPTLSCIALLERPNHAMEPPRIETRAPQLSAKRWADVDRSLAQIYNVLRPHRIDEGFTVPLPQELRTDRLRLRRWLPSDRVPFAALNADPQVMEHFPALLSREESDTLAARIEAHFDQNGFGLWAVEIPNVASFAGFVGLSTPSFEAHFTPCVEIGWRLASEQWGHGYATEGARAVLTFGFRTLALREIVSFTVPDNMRSRQVMERIGMVHDSADDFDHPAMPAEHRLRRHVLYRIVRPALPNTRLQPAVTGAIMSRRG